MPSPTMIVGGALGVIIVLLGIWLGITKIQLADARAQIGVLSGQVEVASQQITKATADVKACGATNDSNQAVLSRVQQAAQDQVASVTASYERKIADLSANQQEKGTIDADAEKCPDAGGTPAAIASAIDFLRRTAAPAPSSAAANNYP